MSLNKINLNYDQKDSTSYEQTWLMTHLCYFLGNTDGNTEHNSKTYYGKIKFDKGLKIVPKTVYISSFPVTSISP